MAIQKGNLIFPNNQVIRFVKRNYRDNRDISILDFGCGEGRNTIALLNEGYKVVAMDYTEAAIKMTIEKCEQIGVRCISVIKNEVFEVPLLAESIDAVIADGSLFYYPKNDIVKTVANLRKVMKSGGLLWADFRTRNDSLCGKGKLLDNGLFQLGEGTDREGCAYFFASEDDIRYIFDEAGLRILSIDDYEYSENGRKTINSWFHVIAQKV